MLDTNLAYDIVGDVPWERNPAFFPGPNAEAYLDSFKDAVGLVRVPGKTVSFLDDTWDFNECFADFNSQAYKVIFAGLPEELKEHCKFCALHMLKDLGIRTVSGDVNSFKDVVGRVLEKSNHATFGLVTTADICAEIESRSIKPRTARGHYAAACRFYRFFEENCGMTLPVDTRELGRLARSNSRKAMAQLEDSKLPDIPVEYFDAILGKAIEVMRNVEAEHNRRATACLLVMLTQLGLRIEDLLGLYYYALRKKKLAKSGLVANFIHYKARKPSRPGEPLVELDIPSNLLCTEAFETLVALREKCTLEEKGEFLYVLNPRGRSKDALPVPEHRFKREYHRFLSEELPVLSQREWPGVARPKLPSSERRVSAPVTAQYRVRLCTVLHEKNVPLLFIQRYMGHLSSFMEGYYARPKDVFQECTAYTEAFIEDIAVEDVRLLGGRYGDEVKAGILDFIDQGEFNVYEDAAEIVKALGPNLIVRAKEGGMCCVATSFLPCSKDARSNELLCAYNLCPNLFHRYHAADVTLVNFLVMQESYAEQLDAGRARMAEKELNKIKDYCTRRLLPELDELDREIGRKGESAILGKHAHLADVIKGRKAIREEAMRWLEK